MEQFNYVFITLAKEKSSRFEGHNKNMALLNKKPLIEWTFDLLNHLVNKIEDCLSYCITDSEIIIELARRKNIKIIEEPKKYVENESLNMEMMRWIDWKINKDIIVNKYIMLPATFPFRGYNTTYKRIREFIFNNWDSAFSISKKGNEYKANGNMFCFTSEQLQKDFVYDENSRCWIDNYNIDIDTIEDLQEAKKYEYKIYT